MAATTNEVLTKPVVAISAAKMNEEMGEFRSVANELKPETAGVGSTIGIHIRKPSDVYSGMIGLPVDANGTPQLPTNPEQVVNVALDSSFTFDALSTRDLTNDLIKREEQVLSQMRVGLQRSLKRRFYYGELAANNASLLSSGLQSGTQGRLTWGDLARALAAVRTSGVGGKLNILLPENGFAALMDTTQNAFLPSTNEQMFVNKLGTFGGADVYRTIVEGLVPGNVGSTAIVTANATGQTTPIGSLDGPIWKLGQQSYIQTNATSGTLRAGTMFQIPGVYAKNIYGETTGSLATFSCLYDINLATGVAVNVNEKRDTLPAGAIPVGKTVGIGFETAIAAGATLSFLNTDTTGNVFLNSVLVYSEKTFSFASATPAKRYVVEEENSSNEGGINIRVGIQGTNETGLTSFRMDVLTGSSGVWSPGGVTLLY